MALSSYDKKLSSSQQAAINKAKNDYNVTVADIQSFQIKAAALSQTSVRLLAIQFLTWLLLLGVH